MPLVWGVLISIDKFCRLCSPCPVLASEGSFPLPCFFFLISGLPRFLDRLAQSFGQGMLTFCSRYLSHCKPLVMKTEFFLLFAPCRWYLLYHLFPPWGTFVSRQQSEAPWCTPLISALKRQRQVDFLGPCYWVLSSGPSRAAQ